VYLHKVLREHAIQAFIHMVKDEKEIKVESGR